MSSVAITTASLVSAMTCTVVINIQRQRYLSWDSASMPHDPVQGTQSVYLYERVHQTTSNRHSSGG
eukprot:11222792-Lingulodinium_polyedra.AAC.1